MDFREPKSGFDEDQVTKILSSIERLRILPERLTMPKEDYRNYDKPHVATLDAATPTASKVVVKWFYPVSMPHRISRLRAARGIRAWAEVDHPNILKLVGFYLHAKISGRNNPLTDEEYLVVPFISSENIEDFVRRVEPNLGERLDFILDISNALQHIHDLNISFGYLDPTLVLVTNSRKVILSFPAWAYELGRDVGHEASGFLGNIRYASPELLNGNSMPPKPQEDIWSWACLALTIITGLVPYRSYRTDSQVVVAILMKRGMPEATLEAAIPAGLLRLLRRCWEFDPSLRPDALACASFLSDFKWKAMIESREISSSHRNIPSTSVLYIKGGVLMHSDHPVTDRGGYCDLYIGDHEVYGRLALKRPRITIAGYTGKQILLLIQEANVWKALSHPHILPFLGMLDMDDHVYLVSPFVENGALPEYLHDHPEVDRPRLLCEVADGLRYLHERGVVHGDVKGANILVTAGVHAQICDFGLSKAADSVTGSSAKGLGTLRWQAPELLGGDGRTFKSDVYSFAMTICEVLSGNVPFHQIPDYAVVTAVFLNDERPPLEPAASPDGVSYGYLWNMAQRCWLRDPDARPSTEIAFHAITHAS